MKNKSLRIIFIAMASVLIMAMVVQLLPRTATYNFKAEQPLVHYFPPSGDGWTVEDVPLGTDANVIAKANSILQFDDYIYRRYAKGALNFPYISLTGNLTPSRIPWLVHTIPTYVGFKTGGRWKTI